jgi:HK97 family phage major capsid protein
MDNQKIEVELPAELAKRFNEAKSQQERNAILAEYATLRGAEDLNKKEAAIMTDDQIRLFLKEAGDRAAANAQAAIEEIAGKVERKYNLGEGDAREMAETSFLKAESRMRNQQKDMEIAAQVIRGIFLARQGRPEAYRNAIEKEAEHYKRIYGREIRAMSLGTDSTGGYLAPTYFSDMLYENIARTSLVRRFATMIPMNANETINIPTMTTGISAATVAEATAADGVEPVFSQKQLTTKKIVTKTNPIAVEMVEKAHPAIVQLLLQHAMIEIMKAEDSAVFGTSGNGIRNTSTNLVTMGSAADADGTAGSGYSSITFDDMINMESELTAEYLGGEDIQGSGIITGAPQYWLPHSLVQKLKAQKSGTGEYLDESRELRNQKQIFGYGAQRVYSMQDGSSLSAGNKVAVFGNLKHVWCGTEPGFRILIADQGVTDNSGGADVNLFDTAQVAIRVMEFFDSVVVDPEAFSIASMAA